MRNLQKRIKLLEKEISQLRLMARQNRKPKVKVSLKGALKGVRFSDSDIRKAKRSLFSRPLTK